jgi:hypothetical protein
MTDDSRVSKILDEAADIATTSIHKAGDIVAGAGEVLSGDVSGGVHDIVNAAGEIATNAADNATQMAKDALGSSGEEKGDAAS